ncbi:uncharacterized protein PAC_10576 [Phialocephala subalpina]|uniref:Uncharacterized protein n=1 Tax=Phialocephala subalpina TaxID=576137 RepID=A0A1L7X6N2_9HELO|nr:uncharacterized protein PAC_10576 [Phialocephala subalpina]
MPERGDDDVVTEKKLKRSKSEVTRLEKRRQRQLRPDMIAKYRGMDLEGEDGVSEPENVLIGSGGEDATNRALQDEGSCMVSVMIAVDLGLTTQVTCRLSRDPVRGWRNWRCKQKRKCEERRLVTREKDA